MGVGQEAQDTAMFRELEERLLQPDVRSSAEEIAKLLADEFIEFGSSGRVFNKHHVIEVNQTSAAQSHLVVGDHGCEIGMFAPICSASIKMRAPVSVDWNPELVSFGALSQYSRYRLLECFSLFLLRRNFEGLC